jgi:hypothetical protein
MPRSRATSSRAAHRTWLQRREGAPVPANRANGDRRCGCQAAESLVEDAAGSIFGPGGWLEMDVDDAVQVSRQDQVAKPPPYAVFTTAHDLVLPSSDLADAANLRKERVLLDRRRAEFRRDLGRLVSRLQRRLLARQMRNWSFDLDDGLVDASRLDRVIVNPGFGSIYSRKRKRNFATPSSRSSSTIRAPCEENPSNSPA